ncbi:MAG: hypothetical protein ACT4OE_10815 [Sphingosinicella sp.]
MSLAVRAFSAMTAPGGGSSALDAPVAALAGLAVAALAFLVPPGLLEAVAETSGLAAILPAAQPPLGTTARIFIAALGALGIFTLVFVLLRASSLQRRDVYELTEIAPAPIPPRREDRRMAERPVRHADRRPEPMPERHPAGDEPDRSPRLRRRDVHPDAPPRPPLLAYSEVGEPQAEASPLDNDWWRAATRAPEPAIAEPVDRQPPLEVPPLPTPPPHRLAGAWLRPEPAAPPVDACADSLALLVERLELGLARRRANWVEIELAEPLFAPPPAAASAPSPEYAPVPVASRDPAAAADRLQSAIASLQRLAARPH